MEERIERPVLYNGRSSNTCAFCAYHGKSLTPRQMRKHKCLAKECDALIRHEHPVWQSRERKKKRRAERKERLERLYIEATGGDAHAIHTEATSAQGT